MVGPLTAWVWSLINAATGSGLSPLGLAARSPLGLEAQVAAVQIRMRVAGTSHDGLDELTQWTRDQRPTVAEIIGRLTLTYTDWATENVSLFR